MNKNNATSIPISASKSPDQDLKVYISPKHQEKTEKTNFPEHQFRPLETDYNHYRNQYAYAKQPLLHSNNYNQQQTFYPASPSSAKYQSPGSLSSYSPASSITGYAYPPYTKFKESSSNNNNPQHQNETAMLNAVAAAAAAVNKNSPQLFSKYIESVHKAMHGNNTLDASPTEGREG